MGAPEAVATASAAKRRSPAVTAAARAARSAHWPTGYEAFSTFTPVKVAPAAVRRAAPTANPE